MKITTDINLPSYSQLVDDYIHTQIFTADQTSSSIKQGIFDALMGSRNIRQGARPSIEFQGQLLQNISNRIYEDEYIELHTVIGPKKTKLYASVDLAELSMLRMLNCIRNNIIQFHPRVRITIRIEDVTGRIFEGESPEIIESMNRYTSDFQMLVKILGYDDFIVPVLESSLGSVKDMKKYTESLHPAFDSYISASDKECNENDWHRLQSYKVLEHLGWKGIIPSAVRRHYIERYQRIYPNMPYVHYVNLMTLYFANTLARIKCNMTAFPVNGIPIKFAPEIPGDLNNGIYYRTVPMNDSKHHVAPWRAKGFFKVNENNNVKITVRSWNDLPEQYEQGRLTLTEGNNSLTIKSDLII